MAEIQQKIVPHLWFDQDAREAASFYCAVFPDSGYGLSWQIVPGELSTMMTDADPERVNRVTRAVLEMKKLDLAALQEAYDGR
ncbi:VOC family protein [Thiocapsa rosea]|uniref:3-demethylubiquinone-9 3-methyltransferase n=1 Tax=Thiocapsa rosea TaxID=69360 RepID=A0A495V104_9GAMM|nr:VOC family protein [Thiocapsa rosea]RKT43014.1 3-demethylubiquinone-9 3-methyltransferase [Thiocapsa rosea]